MSDHKMCMRQGCDFSRQKPDCDWPECLQVYETPATSGTGSHERLASTHTPGPWHVSEHSAIEVNAEGARAIVELWRRGNPAQELANARLIAAAPDLLAVLEAIVEDSDIFSTLDESLLAEARAAIKKARGE
jgi:hypothetical protein